MKTAELTAVARNFRIYRPNKNGSGNAAEFQIKGTQGNYPEYFVMMQIVPQEGFDDKENAKFTWSRGDNFKGITIKLGIPDIGEILSVLNGVQNSTNGSKGLYHQNNKGNSLIKFERNEKGISLSVSQKIGDGSPLKYFITLSIADAEVLRLLLAEAVKKNYGWC